MKDKNTFITTTSQYRSAVMGLSMISIMLFHQYFTSIIPFNLFHHFGYWGVDVFLFLSGMGLVKSLNNNSLKVYYFRRFKRLIPSCILCGSTKYIFVFIFVSYFAILKNELNISTLSIMSLDLWFIHTIIILYAISPLLYYSLKKWTYITISLIFFLFFLNGVFVKPEVGFDWLSPIGIFSWTTDRLPVFGAGMFIAMKGEWIDMRIRYSFPFLLLAIGLNLLEKTEMTFQGIETCQCFSLMIGMPALISLCTFFIDNIPNKLKRVINFFGIYSLELYLVHEFIHWIMKVNFVEVNPFLMLSWWFVLSCFSAYVCKWLLVKCKLS